MAIRFLTILLSTFFLTSFVHAQEHVVVRSDWKKFFSDLQAEGAIVIADERQAEHALLVFGQSEQQSVTRLLQPSSFHTHFLHSMQAPFVMSSRFFDGMALSGALRATIKTKTCDQRCEILRSGFMSYLQRDRRGQRKTLFKAN